MNSVRVGDVAMGIDCRGVKWIHRETRVENVAYIYVHIIYMHPLLAFPFVIKGADQSGCLILFM